MNTPTHLIAGALTAQVAMVVVGKDPRRVVQIAAGVGCLILAMGTHLGLDLIPHYNWIIYLHWFQGVVPYPWLVRQAVFGIPVVVLAVYCGEEHPVLTFIGCLGGMYPDFEKVAYLDFHMPARYVLFPWHSLRCTAFDPSRSHAALIAQEMAIFLVMAAAIVGLSQWRKRRLQESVAADPAPRPDGSVN